MHTDTPWLQAFVDRFEVPELRVDLIESEPEHVAVNLWRLVPMGALADALCSAKRAKMNGVSRRGVEQHVRELLGRVGRELTDDEREALDAGEEENG